MGALVLAAMLAADGPDAGFSSVVLDVNRGALWLNLPDGGVSDAPVVVKGGVYEDDQTAQLTGKADARGTAEREVPPNVGTGTVLLISLVMFGIGAAGGFLGGLAAAKKF